MSMISNPPRWLRGFLLLTIMVVTAVFFCTALTVSHSQLSPRLQIAIIVGTIPVIVLCFYLLSITSPPSGPFVASEKTAENEIVLTRPLTTDSRILEFIIYCGFSAFLFAIAYFGSKAMAPVGPMPLLARSFAGVISFLAALPLITFGATVRGGAGISKITILPDRVSLQITDHLGRVRTKEVLFTNMSLRYSKVAVPRYHGAGSGYDEYLRIYDGGTALPKIRQNPYEIMTRLSSYGVPVDQSPDRAVQAFVFIMIGLWGALIALKIFLPRGR